MSDASNTYSTLRLIMGDQLSHDIAALQKCGKNDLIMLCEVLEEVEYVPHHKQKITLILSAMRHFAQELRDKGHNVHYVALDDTENRGNFTDEVQRATEQFNIKKIIVTHPSEWRVLSMVKAWEKSFKIPVNILEDTRFICSPARFSRWAHKRRGLRMEYFYREMRAETGLLMQDNETPQGGQWNYDTENRQTWPKDCAPPERLRFTPDSTTRQIQKLVEEKYSKNFGNLDNFEWAVTRKDAVRALEDFIEHSLPEFGKYQDAMKKDAPFLKHSLISPYINIGLLNPQEVCEAAEAAYYDHHAPIESVEGFIRQIIGWREYIRGIYWLKMPDYPDSNALDADRKLPSLYWSGDTKMVCMAQSIQQIQEYAYGHHIQRLMITGNFALLAGIEPKEIERWYLAVYIDAFEWVELPNVHGMALFADGGLMSSKPYAASGRYIHNMSDYCKNCTYDIKTRIKENSCPFTFLYWSFLIKNEKYLSKNHRMSFALRNLKRIDENEKEVILKKSSEFLDSL
ncbi:deoxyribodipyrimidine photolyase-related protein [Neokomagataea thailandica NBRC 106555]|uniref:Cryptochrome/photolyase family protein n=2 Tax=Neokomagataea TaxID=1223423 RepID=A0A4Y6V887_9PROT|nr:MULTISPECIES: cryptochrome/photolyase family protein [Neokomagataea]QDH24575.1 cryptochrome/photolyase family protein [Neokomagataea tanensis]GBR52387.1 deoxyribodipyrimidine photolyase-related protein [Neokomagataea thailandica NBRC 106555]